MKCELLKINSPIGIKKEKKMTISRVSIVKIRAWNLKFGAPPDLEEGFEKPLYSLRERHNFIFERMNNRNAESKIRSSDRDAGYRDFEGWNIDPRELKIEEIRQGTIIAPESDKWMSTTFGIDYLDLQIEGLDPKREGLSRTTLLEIIKERLVGRGSNLPIKRSRSSLDINILEGAVPIRSPQRDLRNTALATKYIRDDFAGIFEEPAVVNEERLFELFSIGGFSDAIKGTTTPLQKLSLAIAILSPFEREIIRRRYGLDQGTVDTQKAIANDHNLSSSAVRKYESNVLLFFRRLNHDRNNNLWHL